jgi:HK97 family phage portal protein
MPNKNTATGRKSRQRLLGAQGPGVSSSLAGRGRSRLMRRGDLGVMLTDWTPPVGELPPASESDALGLPAFGRSVAIVASAIAGLNWWAMRWDPELGVDTRIPDQPAVLVKPDPIQTCWHYKWATTEDLILYGNHLALLGDLDYRTGRPGWLVPVPADEIWLLWDPNNPGAFTFTVAGVTLDPSEVLHISAGNRSGEVLGRGVLAQYGDALAGAVAAESHAGQYFAGGALPPAVLQSPTQLTQEQGDELKSKWRLLTSTREPVVLPTGYILTPLVSDADKAQLVQSRQWNAEESAMIVGVPAWLLGLPGPSMTYQNVEDADIAFVRDTVDRWAQPTSAVFTDELMPRGVSVGWDYAGRLRSDQSTTSTVLSTYVSAGILSVDEARAAIGRPPSPTPGPAPAPAPAELTPQVIQ